MVHKITGWLKGYVLIRINGIGSRRFVNLCHNHGIELWAIRHDSDNDIVYCKIMLSDFYRLRPIARKCRVMPLIIDKYGLPFVLEEMKKRISFYMGVCLFFALLLFFASRIWGIEINGQSYHTKESLLKYFNENEIYGGMAVKDVECSKIREDIRHSFEDIGWVSAELSGSKLIIKIKEVSLVSEEKKTKKAANLVADDAGTVVSIVTSSGTAKVRAGDKVKKGRVLISGIDEIIGDNDELVRKRKVRAEGKVVVESIENYEDKLDINYIKKEYTGRKKYYYQLKVFGNDVFFYNPLNSLETYEKCDIIREGGRICDVLSKRFPLYFFSKCYAETKFSKAEYSDSEAEKILKERFNYHIDELKQNDYKIIDARISIYKDNGKYTAVSNIVKQKEQNTYRKLKSKSA